MIVGIGSYRYAAVDGWGRGEAGRSPGGVVTGVGTDSTGRVYFSRRKPPAILVYDGTGAYLGSWGEQELHNPHGVFVDGHDHVWVTDTDDHTVREFSTEGELLRILGTPGQPGEPDQPFNRPTKAVVSEAGELFVSDGYGQCRVHRFSAEGEFIASWGSRGREPGQFALPHAVCVDAQDRVFVADRENSRIQVFESSGRFCSQWSDASWPGLQWPNDLCADADGTMFVAEAGHRISLWRKAEQPLRSPIGARSSDWELLTRWGDVGSGTGQFSDCPHAICVDLHGNIYVAEVPFTPDRVHKFERLR